MVLLYGVVSGPKVIFEWSLACSPCVVVSFIHHLWFPPTFQTHAKLTDKSKLALGDNGCVIELFCVLMLEWHYFQGVFLSASHPVFLGWAPDPPPL